MSTCTNMPLQGKGLQHSIFHQIESVSACCTNTLSSFTLEIVCTAISNCSSVISAALSSNLGEFVTNNSDKWELLAYFLITPFDSFFVNDASYVLCMAAVTYTSAVLEISWSCTCTMWIARLHATLCAEHSLLMSILIWARSKRILQNDSSTSLLHYALHFL